MSVSRFQMSFDGGRKVVLVQLTMMDDKCCHVWLGSDETEERSMNNLVTSIQTKYDSMPLARPILSTDTEDVRVGVNNDDWATALAQKLAKRLAMQVFVSCSFSSAFDSELLQNIEQHIVTYVAK